MNAPKGGILGFRGHQECMGTSEGVFWGWESVSELWDGGENNQSFLTP